MRDDKAQGKGLNLRRRKQTPAQPNRLISELESFEDQLQAWIKSSPANARFFRRDPLAAMQAAGLDIDDDIMLELQIIVDGIAQKLK